MTHAARDVLPAGFDDRLDAFLRCHVNPTNVALHLLSTPLILLGAFGVVDELGTPATFALAAAYLATLALELARPLFAATTLATLSLATLAVTLSLPPWVDICCIVGGYLVQSLAHRVTREVSFQASYRSPAGRIGDWLHHSWMMLPWVIVAALRRGFPGLRWLIPRKRVLHGALGEAHERDLAILRRAALEHGDIDAAQAPITTLDVDARDAARRITASPGIERLFRTLYGAAYAIEIVEGMNELQVTTPQPGPSMAPSPPRGHVDGPLAFLPFASLYRCVVGITPNHHRHMNFPMAGVPSARPDTYTVGAGDVLAFDQHRELRFLTQDDQPTSESPEITLALHYVVYPRVLWPLGVLLARASTAYEHATRDAVSSALGPTSLGGHLRRVLMRGSTHLVDVVQRWMGAENLLYVLLCGVISLVAHDPLPFVLGTGFVHYLLYIVTYHHRDVASFGLFVRNAVFFKTVSTVTLFAIYASYATFDLFSLVVAAVGYGIAMAATRALGVERTYFGVELGLVPPKFITAFPYNAVPHPMIVGGMLALLGLYALEPMRADWPWLVPAHISLYLAHMLQEHLGLYAGNAADVPTGATA